MRVFVAGLNALARWMVLAATVLLAACGNPEPYRQESYVFGTRIEVRLPGTVSKAEEQLGRDAVAEVLREFDRLHRQYHAWQASDLTALNSALAAGKTHEVSPELAGLIREAQSLAKAGEYLFDPGIGALVALWGFQSDEVRSVLPAEQSIAGIVAQHPSIADLRVDGLQVNSRNRAVALDFGGYLKGVALDRAAVLLRARGVQHALVNIGGNILALGNREGKPGGKAWRVGIQHPRSATVGNVPLASLELRDGEAIGTSGDYHRFFEVAQEGKPKTELKRYCHLIDPRTGYPSEKTQSLTILIPPAANAGMRSDALSKPLFISGEHWQDMARKLGVAAVLRVGAGGTAEATPSMKERLTIEVPDLRLDVRG